MFQVQGRLAEQSLMHRHSDGSWGEMERTDHDAAEHDPEREWLKGDLFTCKECGEEVVVSHPLGEPGDGDTT